MIRLKKILSQKFLKISNYNGGEGGIEPRTVACCWFSNQCFQPLGHLSSELLTPFLLSKLITTIINM